jgi:glucose-6-phosphate 1-dehydrogenase
LNQSAKKILKIRPFNTVIFGGDGDLAIRKIYQNSSKLGP